MVIYDTLGIFSAPRGLFTFKGESSEGAREHDTETDSAFGHDRVSVLDGGLPRWISEGYDAELGDVPNHPDTTYSGATDPPEGLIRSESLCSVQILQVGMRLPASAGSGGKMLKSFG